MTYVLLALYALVHLGDMVTTYLALTRIEGAYEANPWAAWAFRKVGMVPTLVVAEIAALALGVWMIGRPYGYLAVGLLTAGGVYVLVNNLRQLRP